MPVIQPRFPIRNFQNFSTDLKLEKLKHLLLWSWVLLKLQSQPLFVERTENMLHARPDYQDRIQDLDIVGMKALFEEMLESLKADYLAPWTDSRDGVVHPAGLNRWRRDENYYRRTFAKIMTPAIPLDEPVFLLRGQDAAAGAAVETWIRLSRVIGVKQRFLDLALRQAEAISRWPKKKAADVPEPEAAA
jgi:hypothetical protein